MKISALRSRLTRLGTALLLILGLVVLVPGTAALAADGDIVINEIIQNPSAVADSAGEWFEVYNAGDTDVDIDGWTIQDNDFDSHVIDNGGPLVVPAGGFLVLGNNTDTATNGGAPVAYSYGSGFFLANGGDELVLISGDATEIDRVEWDGGPNFPDPTGASMSLSDPALDNNVGANWCEATTTFGDGDLGTPGAANEGCDTEPPPPPPPPPGELCEVATTHTIPEIQGSGSSSPFDGTSVVVQGVVTGLFPDVNLFAIQDPTGDADPATSDGIMVFAPTAAVAVGDTVVVDGVVDEFFGLTEITSVSGVEVCSSGGSVAPTLVPMPQPEGTSFEPFEGMLVTFDTLYVTDTFNLHRFGEALMSSGGPLVIPTDVAAPGAAANALQDLNNRNQIILDDANSSQFPTPVPYLAADDTVRRGDSIDGLTAVMSFGFSNYRLYPTEAPNIVRVNDRPDGPNDVGGPIKVASFNVLNYFTTIHEPGNDARGADSAAELARQEAKLAEGIIGLGADIVGLQEIESGGQIDVPGNTNAQQSLVDALNAIDPNPTWAAVPDPAYPGGLASTNAIKVAIIYRTDRATPAFTGMADDDPVWAEDRPPVAQAFVADGELFTVVVNHFKSKGSSGATGADLDQGDGQGAYNFRRTLMAERLLDFVGELQVANGDPDVIVLGDFNSYSMEDPIATLRSGLTEIESDTDPYSLVFFGQQGQLDYVFATGSQADRMSGATTWHINADEPRVLDYNDDIIDPSESGSDFSQLYFVDEFRSSDHDPLVAGMKLSTPAQLKQQAADSVAALLAQASGNDARALAAALDAIEDSLDPALWQGEVLLNSQFGHKVFSEEKRALVQLALVTSGNVQGVIHNLLFADLRIAEAAIDLAQNTGGDPAGIAAAEAAVAAGWTRIQQGKWQQAVDRFRQAWERATAATDQARFATFNASLNRFNAGDLISDLSTPANAQAAAIAEIIQRARPEVLLINEFDFDAGGVAADLFRENYLEVPHNGAAPIYYPYAYVAPSNTGIPSGFDLDNSGSVGGPGDAFGFGFFEGQFGMLVLSMHPIDFDNVRTFQTFLWKDMPGALLPDDPAVVGPADWYSPEELDVFRLSSKSHWDVPVQVAGETIHFLVSHPTPPVFDGPEDRNGTRNHDEIRFWADYVDPTASDYIYDDAGVFGGLPAGANFVVAGDQNSDPLDGDSIPGSAQLLLDHPLVNTSVTPASDGGVEAAALQGGANASHLSDPAFDTADFSDFAPGNLRADYVLPSATLDIVDAAVFWPVQADPLFGLVGTFPFPSSDHRLVWVDIAR